MDHLPLRHCFSPLGKEGHCHFTDRIRVVFVVFFFFNFLALLCGMQDLSSLTSDGTSAPAVEVWSVNCWTTGEVPAFFTLQLLKPPVPQKSVPLTGWLEPCLVPLHQDGDEDDVVPCAGELTAMAGAGRLAMSAPRLRNRPKGARDQGLQEEGRESRREGGSREQMEGLSFPSAL